jgi:hypothetical protein
VDSEAAHVAAAHLVLAGVQAGPHLQAEQARYVGHRTRTADGARWAVEGREHAVACLFHHPAAEASHLGAARASTMDSRKEVA